MSNRHWEESCQTHDPVKTSTMWYKYNKIYEQREVKMEKIIISHCLKGFASARKNKELSELMYAYGNSLGTIEN